MTDITPNPTTPAPADSQPAQASEAPQHSSTGQHRASTGQFTGVAKDNGVASANASVAAAAKRMVKYNVGKQEHQAELGDDDLPNALSELHQLRELKRGFHKKFEEVANQRKAWEEEKATWESRRNSAAEDAEELKRMLLGDKLDLKRLPQAKQHLAAVLRQVLEMESEAENPDKRQLRELQHEKASMEAEAGRQKAREQAKATAEEFNKVLGERRTALQATLSEAVKSHGLPATERMLAAAADIHLDNLKHGVQLSPGEVAQMAREDMQVELAAMTDGMDGATIRDMWPALYTAVHRDLVKRAKGGKESPPQARPSASPRPKESGPILYAHGSLADALKGAG